MAESFTLPDELFNSMINGFNKESEEKQLYIDSNEKSKIDEKNKNTILILKQKKRIGNIASTFFSIDDVKNIFKKDFVKYVDKIEEQEVTQAVTQIIDDVKDDIKEKKKKKKTSLRSSIRKYRMMIRLYAFAKKVFDNFKKFQKHAHEILNKHNRTDDVTLMEALKDETKRKKYIEQKKKLFGDIITAFFNDVIKGSVIPAIEFIIRMIVDSLLELFRKFSELIEKFGDVILAGLNKSKKMIFKMVGKKAAKMAAKAAARHATASAVAAAPAVTGVGAVIVPFTEAIVNVVGIAWDLYDAANLAYDIYSMYQTGKKAYNEAGKVLIGWTENAIKAVEKAEQNADAMIGKFGANLKKSANNIKAKINQNINEHDILNKKETKIALFNEIYKSIEENRDSAISEFLKNDANYKDFTKNEIAYMEKNGMSSDQYVPYSVYGVTWLDFFNKFVDGIKTTMKDIEKNSYSGKHEFGFSEQIRSDLEKLSAPSEQVEDFKEPEIKRPERKIEDVKVRPDETWEYNNFLTNFRIELAENRKLQGEKSSKFDDIKEVYKKMLERLIILERHRGRPAADYKYYRG